MNTHRREFLALVSRGLLAIAALGSSAMGGLARAAARARELLPADFPRASLKDLDPAEVDNSQLPRHELGDLGVMGESDAPALEGYALKVGGNVENPTTFTFAQISALPTLEKRVLLICPGFFANNVDMRGISLAEIVKRVKPKKDTRSVVFLGVDDRMGMFESWEIEGKNMFLAYDINQTKLPEPHGYPLRLVAPDEFGGKWIKWLVEIDFRA